MAQTRDCAQESQSGAEPVCSVPEAKRALCQLAKEPAMRGTRPAEYGNHAGDLRYQAPLIAVPRTLQSETKGISCPSCSPLRFYQGKGHGRKVKLFFRLHASGH